MMPSVLLSTLGSPGDINPFIALALALRDLDVTPIFLANPYDLPVLERHGFEAVPVGESWDLMALVASDPKYLLSPQAGTHTTRDIFIPFSEKLYPATRAAIEKWKPGVVVAHAFCFGAHWAAEDAGVPRAVVHLAPISLLTRDLFAVYPPLGRLLMTLAVPLGQAQFDRLVRPLCEKLGVPWSKGILSRTMVFPDLLLGMWSPRFAPLSTSSRRGTLHACGFPSMKTTEALEPALEAFLEAGSVPVAVTLGTNAFAFAGAFFETTLGVLVARGHRVVVITKRPLEELPERCLSVPYADYKTLFPRCCAVIHHGGVGVTGAALTAGVPSVVVPFGHDQKDNALRVQALRVGRHVPRRKIARKLPAALEALLTAEVAERARDLGEALRADPDGPTTAATLIIQCLQ